MTTAPTKTVDDAYVETVARDACAHPKTVTRVLAGLPVRGRVGERIAKVIAARSESRDSTPPTAPMREVG